MEFLVHIEVNWPADGDEQLRHAIVDREAKRASELAAEGIIVRLWRVPGRWANIGLWRAKDASDLHEAILSLPMFPWLDVAVEALARHPSDPA